MSVSAVAGVADFSSLKIGGVSGSYVVRYWIDSPSLEITQSFTVSPAVTATRLKVTQQQVDKAFSGTNLYNTIGGQTVYPAAAFADDYDNIVSAQTGSITGVIIRADGTSVGAASQTITATNGIASFNGLSATTAALTDYIIRFTSGSLTSADSDAFNMDHGAAAQIQIQTQPGNGITGNPLSGQPVIVIKDAAGNITTRDNSTVVTARLASGTGFSLSGTLTATVVKGVATFTGLVVTGPATAVGASGSDVKNFTLKFTTPRFESSASNAKLLRHAMPASLSVATGSSTAKSGITMSQNLILQVQDKYGNAVTDWSRNFFSWGNNTNTSATYGRYTDSGMGSGFDCGAGYALTELGTKVEPSINELIEFSFVCSQIDETGVPNGVTKRNSWITPDPAFNPASLPWNTAFCPTGAIATGLMVSAGNYWVGDLGLVCKDHATGNVTQHFTGTFDNTANGSYNDPSRLFGTASCQNGSVI